MPRPFNFSPGPAMVPGPVLQQAQAELVDWHNCGTSVMEMSHRGKEFTSISRQAEADLRELLAIPDNYKVLFLQGGASGQFAAVPMNLLGDKNSADYLNTGIWSKKAIKEAGRYCKVNLVGSSEAQNFSTVPSRESWQCDSAAAYLHYTPNETIGGLEIHDTPEVGEVPLVADMSSTILSRPIDVSRFGVIYAGAQKNIGIAGLTVVIVRDDLLDRAQPITPSFLHYRTQADNDSMSNTPPAYAWYLAGLVFQWIKAQGGLDVMGQRNQQKAEMLYAAIDNSNFYHNPIEPAYRSWMNIPFTLADDALNESFLAEAKAIGLLNLKGHRSVGGMRASIYNAMPLEGVTALIDFMNDFARHHG